MPAIFECKSIFHCSVDRLFLFHEEPVGFQTLVALDKSVKVLQAPESISKIGTQAILEVTLAPLIKKKWIAEHIGYNKNEIFIDIQKEGPFLSFRHEHRFSKVGEYSELTDHIKFEFFLNPISKFFVAQKIKSQFKARHKATADYLQVEYKNTFCGLT
jgi:ligand-binding SRPBCC domain-containing protein